VFCGVGGTGTGADRLDNFIGIFSIPWLTRWISPDSAGTVDGLNLYVYVGNNPLKYSDPTGHFPLISWGRFVKTVNAYKKNQRDLNIWVGENHATPQGNYLAIK
jgi:hypothetical protein